MTDPTDGPPAETIVLQFTHTTTRTAEFTPAQIRRVFGLGGTPADDLVDRLVLLLKHRPSLLAGDDIENVAQWVSDTGHLLTHVNGFGAAEAPEYVTIAGDTPAD